MGARIAVVLTARPSYAKLQPVIAALLRRGEDVQLIACASALLERYGKVVDVVRQDFPSLDITEVWSTYEGANLLTSAKETGALLSGLAQVLLSLRPDAVVVCADRHEVLGAAQAAAYLHLPLVHLQGGERTGSIDDKARDAITALADVHCVSTKHAAMRVWNLTGATEGVHRTGCPSIDVARAALEAQPVTSDEINSVGLGDRLEMSRPFVVLMQHPVTDEPDSDAHLHQTLLALRGRPVLVFWPGQDAGQEPMAKLLRHWQGQKGWHFVRSMPPTRFLRLLSQAACLVGNSSAGIREASYLGTPVVNIGTRQQGRERAANVMDVGYDKYAIAEAVARQVVHGRYQRSTLYGTGDAAERIAAVCGALSVRGPAQDRDGLSAVRAS